MKFGQSAEPSIAEHHKKALEKHAPPSVLVDENFEILHLSPKAGRFLIHPGGVPTSLLLKLIREELRIELQTALFQSFEHRLATSSPPIKVRFNGQERFVSLVVQPVVGDNDSEMALVLFLEVGETREAYTGGGKTTLPREKHLEGELRKVREQLRCTIEEFESSEEEMKASNEELQSMSEEHRSTGEELETNKEELQFVNEKLERVNQELAGKVKALRQANSDLQNLIASLKQDVIRRKALQKKNVEARARQQRSLGERIHDGLAQQVSGVRMLAKSFLQQSKKDKQINPDDVEELLRHLESAENEIQTVVRELVPITFEENAGLVVALERMVERLSELWPAADCRIEADDSVSVVDDLAALKLYHIAQEAVQNALKHGHPTEFCSGLEPGAMVRSFSKWKIMVEASQKKTSKMPRAWELS